MFSERQKWKPVHSERDQKKYYFLHNKVVGKV